MQRLFDAAKGPDGLVSRPDAELIRKYLSQAPITQEGKVTPEALYAAREALQRDQAALRATSEARQAQLQRELAENAEELRNLMEAVRHAQEAKAAATQSDRKAGRRKARSKSP